MAKGGWGRKRGTGGLWVGVGGGGGRRSEWLGGVVTESSKTGTFLTHSWHSIQNSRRPIPLVFRPDPPRTNGPGVPTTSSSTASLRTDCGPVCSNTFSSSRKTKQCQTSAPARPRKECPLIPELSFRYARVEFRLQARPPIRERWDSSGNAGIAQGVLG